MTACGCDTSRSTSNLLSLLFILLLGLNTLDDQNRTVEQWNFSLEEEVLLVVDYDRRLAILSFEGSYARQGRSF